MFRRRVPLSFTGRVREILWPRKGFSRWYSYLVQRVLRMPGSAYSLASGFACGVAVSFTPLVGFHLLLACGLAYFIRGNLATALLGTIFGNPWTFPLIFVLLQAIGEGLIRYFGLFSESTTPEVGDVYGQFMAYFIPMALGGVLMFIVSWVISFSICYWGIVSWREHRMKKKHKKQHMENTT